jgi:hypothetical protein
MAATGPPRRGPFMNRAANSQPRRGVFQGRRRHGKYMGMRGIFFIALGALFASACNAEQPLSTNDNSAADGNSAAPAATPEGKPVALKSETPLIDWEVSWPAEVNAIPALERLIRQPAEQALAEYSKAAREDKARRDKDGFDFNPYEYSVTVEVAGQTPRLLSLAREWMEYTGGAHPNHGTEALLWDKGAGARLAFDSLVEGGAATLDRLYRDAFCKALDGERARRRQGLDSVPDPNDPFYQCPKFGELQIIAKGPAAGGPMSRLWFHADPYVAGPYAEGDYDIELPVSGAFVAALKPEYRASFAAR